MPLEDLLQASAAMHRHLCPRQVLGVRMGLLAGELLEMTLPRRDKQVFVIIETDGCFADGISVATGCTVGHRNLRVEDIGKVAATFADTATGRAVRIAPCSGVRALAPQFAPTGSGKWEAQLIGYQRMPADLLFSHQWVHLVTPMATVISHPGRRALCQVCHEEIINEREVIREGSVVCRACAGYAYYRPVSSRPALAGSARALLH